MICLVDMENRQAVRSSPGGANRDTRASTVPQAYMRDVQRRLETVSQDRCMLLKYREVTWERLEGSKVQALILSGNVTEWDAYKEADLRPLTEIVRSASLPILGLCGGLQFIAMAHGARVGPIRALERSEEDVCAGIGAGYLKEWGFTAVQVSRPDPLFEGLEAPVFLEAHYWEVKTVPAGFKLLASAEVCRIQALRRTGTLVYGTQFHPEAYIDQPADRHNWLIELVCPGGYSRQQLDGRRLLANFFRLAGIT